MTALLTMTFADIVDEITRNSDAVLNTFLLENLPPRCW